MPWLRKRNDVQEMLEPIHIFATEPGIHPLDGYNQKGFLWKHYFHYIYP